MAESFAVGPLSEELVRRAGILAVRQAVGDADLLSFPKRPNGTPLLLRQSFFERLLNGKMQLASFPAADVSGAQMDVRKLALPQLLFIRCSLLDANFAPMSTQAAFVQAVDTALDEQLLRRLSQEGALTASEGVVRLSLLAYGAHAELQKQGASLPPAEHWLVRADGAQNLLHLPSCELRPLDVADPTPAYVHSSLLQTKSAVPRERRKLHWEVQFCESPAEFKEKALPSRGAGERRVPGGARSAVRGGPPATGGYSAQQVNPAPAVRTAEAPVSEGETESEYETDDEIEPGSRPRAVTAGLCTEEEAAKAAKPHVALAQEGLLRQAAETSAATAQAEVKRLEAALQEAKVQQPHDDEQANKVAAEASASHEEARKAVEELAVAREEAAKLREEADKSASELATAKEEAERAKEETEKARAELAEVTKFKEEADKSASELATAKEEAERAKEETEKVIAELAEVTKFKEEADKSASELATAKEEAERAKEETEKVIAELAEVTKFKEEADKSASELATAKEEVERAKEETEKVRAELAEASEAASKNTGELAGLAVAKEEAAAARVDANKSASELTAAREEVKTLMAELAAAKEAAEKAASELSDARANAEESADAMALELTSAKEEAERAKEETQKVMAELAAAREDVSQKTGALAKEEANSQAAYELRLASAKEAEDIPLAAEQRDSVTASNGDMQDNQDDDAESFRSVESDALPGTDGSPSSPKRRHSRSSPDEAADEAYWRQYVNPKATEEAEPRPSS
eukprot:TRINITY_DN6890_c0_g1_i3.p1 TRINITY_DN6890_c0_g1~~TRINITY_DN6890_c0_g1_i3.p1  ORF type:complete len:762 (-),score=260.93 TRINITY_DN6890_c0_g1_i3:60-2345(-)